MTTDWWTLALQGFNFLILVWLLRLFLFRPVVAAIKVRSAKIDDLLNDAKAAKADAEAGRRKVDAEVEKLEAMRQSAIADARAAAEDERERILADAKKKSDIQLAEARKRLDAERQAAEQNLLGKASRIAVDIAEYLLRNVNDNDRLNTVFLDQACAQLSTVAANERAQIIGANKDDTPIKARLVTASPIGRDDVTAFEGAISKALGHAVVLDAADDAALIAGLELHFPHVVIRHNWRDALAEAAVKMSPHHEDAQRHA